MIIGKSVRDNVPLVQFTRLAMGDLFCLETSRDHPCLKVTDTNYFDLLARIPRGISYDDDFMVIQCNGRLQWWEE